MARHKMLLKKGILSKENPVYPDKDNVKLNPYVKWGDNDPAWTYSFLDDNMENHWNSRNLFEVDDKVLFHFAIPRSGSTVTRQILSQIVNKESILFSKYTIISSVKSEK